jgi:SpoVK/Ycf46/Vps4 family AAA+-type ATPase
MLTDDKPVKGLELEKFAERLKSPDAKDRTGVHHLKDLQKILGYLRRETQRKQKKEYRVLFIGERGTGKTLAARVLAGELGLDIYRVDLSTVISKYIGETEKNLDRVFKAAEASDAVLFFDEADALFAGRSDVNEPDDRFANTIINYLLQKMEAYAGVSILATYRKKNIDDAFLKRLQAVIAFPLPA